MFGMRITGKDMGFTGPESEFEYKDFPRMELSKWKSLKELLNKDEYVQLTDATYKNGVEKFGRGQMLLSESGLNKVQEFLSKEDV